MSDETCLADLLALNLHNFEDEVSDAMLDHHGYTVYIHVHVTGT